MRQDFTPSSVPLSSFEQEDLRKDLRQGCLAAFLPVVIAGGFVWMFAESIPQDTLPGKLFIWLPLAFVTGLTILMLYHLNGYRMDLNAGIKIAVQGRIENKHIRDTPKLTGSLIRNLPERTRHSIVVNRKKYLIKGFEYDACEVGQQVNMYVTPYSKRVLDLKLTDAYTIHNHY